MGVPQNGWPTRENPNKMGNLGVPPFVENPIYTYTFMLSFLDTKGTAAIYSKMHNMCGLGNEYILGHQNGLL